VSLRRHDNFEVVRKLSNEIDKTPGSQCVSASRIEVERDSIMTVD
jgi:hypothetical protein